MGSLLVCAQESAESRKTKATVLLIATVLLSKTPLAPLSQPLQHLLDAQHLA
jgi:hypothetical protein